MTLVFVHLIALIMAGFNGDANKDILTCENFELIKKHILTHGDQLTYCNLYSYNPHYNLKVGQLYLNPSFYHRNENTDSKSYTKLVVQVSADKGIIYYDVSCNENGILVLKKNYKYTKSVKDQEFITSIFKKMLTEQKEGKKTIRMDDSPLYKDAPKNSVAD